MNRYIRLLRVNQWYKNFFVFLALFYTKNLLNPALAGKAALAFVALCGVSSSYYILNDIRDREKDRAHPEKKSRPIASGEVGVGTAYAVSLVLLACSLALGYHVKPVLTLYALGLFLSSLTYTLWFREVAFVDIHMIALNFLIRAVAGAVAINVPASPWLIATVFFAALLLALAKRKGDLTLLGEKTLEYRKVYRVYNERVLDSLLAVTTAVLLFTYILYTFIAYKSSLLMLTIPFASIMLMRYLALVEEGHIIARKAHYFFKDRQLVAAFVLWAVASYLIISRIHAV
jgi:4-hydroxybenzoate polyprenyltransferase